MAPIYKGVAGSELVGLKSPHIVERNGLAVAAVGIADGGQKVTLRVAPTPSDLDK